MKLNKQEKIELQELSDNLCIEFAKLSNNKPIPVVIQAASVLIRTGIANLPEDGQIRAICALSLELEELEISLGLTDIEIGEELRNYDKNLS